MGALNLKTNMNQLQLETFNTLLYYQWKDLYIQMMKVAQEQIEQGAYSPDSDLNVILYLIWLEYVSKN